MVIEPCPASGSIRPHAAGILRRMRACTVVTEKQNEERIRYRNKS